MKCTISWVYLIYATHGVELHNDELIQVQCTRNAAELVQEVTLTGVLPENIIAALEIKTTKNEPAVYYVKEVGKIKNPQTIQWQISIRDYSVNDRCTLKHTHPELYERALASFLHHYQQTYFRIPWSPYPEDIYFGLNDRQKEACRDFQLTNREAKQIDVSYKLEALKLGVPRHLILTAKFHLRHLEAMQKGASLQEVMKATYVELVGMADGLSFLEVQGIETELQIYGLTQGFTREDVLAEWFDYKHANAAYKGVPVQDLREVPSAEIEQMTLLNKSFA